MVLSFLHVLSLVLSVALYFFSSFWSQAMAIHTQQLCAERMNKQNICHAKKKISENHCLRILSYTKIIQVPPKGINLLTNARVSRKGIQHPLRNNGFLQKWVQKVSNKCQLSMARVDYLDILLSKLCYLLKEAGTATRYVLTIGNYWHS